MPLRVSPDPAEREALEGAHRRLKEGTPKKAELRVRADRGSLRINLTTLSAESGVKRHRILRLYPDIADAVAQGASERGASPPLRGQLDNVRRLRATAEARLDRSQSYTFRLLERLSQLGTEVKRLQERIDELEKGGEPDEPLIGSPAVIGIPSAPPRHGRGWRGAGPAN
jgi:hypothetical protein